MKRIHAILLITFLFFTACSNNDKKETPKKDKYEQTKENLEETEKKNPTRFLTVDGHDRKNLIRQTVIIGTITNNAKICSYKDVDIELSFYSKTGALLEKNHEMVYETIAPGNSSRFKTKYYVKGLMKMKIINLIQLSKV